MPIGYILAIIFAVIWLGIAIFERIRKNHAKREALKNAVETVKSFDTDVDELIIK